jgi:hypothetical protein
MPKRPEGQYPEHVLFVEPPIPYVPSGHLAHLTELGTLNFPGLQRWQTQFFLCFPAGHSSISHVVGTVVGTADGARVGPSVGTEVGASVGVDVGTGVGTVVGEAVGNTVGIAVGMADG